MFNKSVIIVIVIVIVPLSLPPLILKKCFSISHKRPFLYVLRRKAKKGAFLKIDPCSGINFGYLRTPPPNFAECVAPTKSSGCYHTVDLKFEQYFVNQVCSMLIFNLKVTGIILVSNIKKMLNN